MDMDHMRVEHLKIAKKMCTQGLRGKIYFELKKNSDNCTKKQCNIQIITLK